LDLAADTIAEIDAWAGRSSAPGISSTGIRSPVVVNRRSRAIGFDGQTSIA
jgi:hypothetical protein